MIKKPTQPLEREHIQSFWTLPPAKREVTRKLTAQIEAWAALEAYAEENELIICRGKAIKPEEYPCSCVYCNPELCQKEKSERRGRGYKDGYCTCRCHTYYEPC